jgi:hypothetical protein
VASEMAVAEICDLIENYVELPTVKGAIEK